MLGKSQNKKSSDKRTEMIRIIQWLRLYAVRHKHKILIHYNFQKLWTLSYVELVYALFMTFFLISLKTKKSGKNTRKPDRAVLSNMSVLKILYFFTYPSENQKKMWFIFDYELRFIPIAMVRKQPPKDKYSQGDN